MTDSPTVIDPDENDVDDLPDDVLEPVAEGIARLTRHRHSLRTTLAILKTRWLRDEAVQGEVEYLIEDIDERGETIVALQLLNHFDREDVISECQSREYLSEEGGYVARTLLNEISWISPALEAYRQSRQGRYYPTNFDIRITGNDEQGRLMIGQRATRGVDELWDIQAPLPLMLGQNIQEIQKIILQLQNFPPAVEFPEKELQELEDISDEITNMAEAMESTVESLTERQESDEPGPEDIEEFDPDDSFE